MTLNFVVLTLIFTLICNLLLGVYVFFRDIRNKLYQSYFYLSIVLCFWNMESIVMHSVKNYDTALFGVKIFASIIKFIPIAVFNFIYVLINKKKHSEDLAIKIGLIFSLIFSVLTWIDNLVIKGLTVLPDGSYFILPGNKIINMLLGVHFILLPLYGIYQLYKEYFYSVNTIERRRYYTIFIGVFLSILGGLVDIIFVNLNLSVYPIGQFTTFFFILILAVAILKYHFMEIEIVIKKTVVYATVFSAIMAFFIIVIMKIEYYLKDYMGSYSFWVTAACIALLTLLTQPLREKIYFVVDHYFFKERYDQQDTIRDFAQKLTTELNREQVLNLIMQTISKVVHIDNIGILLKNQDTKNEEFSLMAKSGVKNKNLSNYKVKNNNPIVKYFYEKKNNLNYILSRYDLEEGSKSSIQNREILEEFEKLNTSVVIPIALKDKFLGFINLGDKLSGDIYHSHDFKLLHTICSESAVAIENSILYTDLRNNFLNTVNTLASAIEAKDSYTRGHCDRVSNYAVNVAAHMNLQEAAIDNIRIGSMLHDIGKIGIPDEILLKKGRLTNMEYAEIMKHPSIGAAILSPAKFPEEIISIIRHHHERMNGSGYPDHLIGDEISISTRIVSIADVYEAITSDRAYRSALPHEKAVDILKTGRGDLFDTTIVEIFFDILEEQRRRQEES
ncbi:HD domain-containing protein [Candidatus Poribacteria bacterium]|nr:HD domain-containing protein [Candidatus Poribacteria bacterium]